MSTAMGEQAASYQYGIRWMLTAEWIRHGAVSVPGPTEARQERWYTSEDHARSIVAANGHAGPILIRRTLTITYGPTEMVEPVQVSRKSLI